MPCWSRLKIICIKTKKKMNNKMRRTVCRFSLCLAGTVCQRSLGRDTHSSLRDPLKMPMGHIIIQSHKFKYVPLHIPRSITKKNYARRIRVGIISNVAKNRALNAHLRKKNQADIMILKQISWRESIFNLVCFNLYKNHFFYTQYIFHNKVFIYYK